MAGLTREGRIYDITRPLGPGGIVYPGDIIPRFREQDHGSYVLTDIRISSHSGTHIDAPSHYLESGQSVDQLPFASLMGWCRVIDLRGVGRKITAADLAGCQNGINKILLRTSFSDVMDFDEEYPALSQDAANLIIREGITCIGTDAPSIEEFRGEGTIHRTLLSHGTVIIELLDLHEIREGDYWMIALPLRLRGLDGSPCRALLFEGWDQDGYST